MLNKTSNFLSLKRNELISLGKFYIVRFQIFNYISTKSLMLFLIEQKYLNSFSFIVIYLKKTYLFLNRTFIDILFSINSH